MAATMSTELHPKAPGRLGKALVRLLMKHASVVEIEQLAESFRLVTLEGSALADVAWTPGQKIQIAMGSAFIARTYTPIEWERAAGRTRFLGYLHGDGPGSAWIRGLKPGDECNLFGPRSSVDVSAVAGPLAVIGDETSIGLAYALLRQDRARAVACLFEVEEIEASRRVTARLGIDAAELFARTADDAQLDAMETAAAPHIKTGTTFVLTGRASTIQRFRKSLKQQAVPTTRIVTKAYWAPGKTGLD